MRQQVYNCPMPSFCTMLCTKKLLKSADYSGSYSKIKGGIFETHNNLWIIGLIYQRIKMRNLFCCSADALRRHQCSHGNRFSLSVPLLWSALSYYRCFNALIYWLATTMDDEKEVEPSLHAYDIIKKKLFVIYSVPCDILSWLVCSCELIARTIFCSVASVTITQLLQSHPKTSPKPVNNVCLALWDTPSVPRYSNILVKFSNFTTSTSPVWRQFGLVGNAL